MLAAIAFILEGGKERSEARDRARRRGGEGVETSGTGFRAVPETDQSGKTSTPSMDASAVLFFLEAATYASSPQLVESHCRALGGFGEWV